MGETKKKKSPRGAVASTRLRTASLRAHGELKDAGQQLHGRIRGVSWAVPQGVEVVDGLVTWPCEYRAMKRRVRDPEADFLQVFLALAYSEKEDLDRAVAAVARNWGPLWICERHCLPSSHTRPPGVGAVQVWIEGRKLGDCPPARTEDGSRWVEPVEAWHRLAHHARALVLARTDLHRSGRLSKERRLELEALTDFDTIVGVPADAERGPEGAYVLRREHDDVATQRFFIPEVTTSAASVVGRSMQWWLDQGAIRPTIGSRSKDFGMELRADSLFGAIALRLASNLMNARPLVPCDYCGNLYVQTRTGTYFCGSDECDKARIRENAARRARGEARRYKPRKASASGG